MLIVRVSSSLSTRLVSWSRNFTVELATYSCKFYASSFVSLTSRFLFPAFQLTLIYKNLDAMSIAICCSSDYFFFFPLIINVSVTNYSAPSNLLCLNTWGETD